MKIVSLTAENVKKLRAVQITPDGALVQITGKNGSGKSSVLDSIFYALAGGKELPKKPIRNGEHAARIKLDLGELIVTRKFTEGGASTLTVEGATGARFPSPQRMLDDLVGAISFDPLEFSRMEPRQQFDTLRRVVKLEVDIDALNGQNATDFEARTEVNRRVKALRAQATVVIVPDGLPAVGIEIADLTERLQKAGDANALLERRKAGRQQAERDIQSKKDAATQQRMIAEDLRREAAEADARAAALDGDAAGLQKRLDGADQLPEPVDTAALLREIEAARTTNNGIAKRLHKQDLERQITEAEAEAQRLTDAIEARNQAKVAAITSTKMPIDDLTFGDGAVLFKGLPFEQGSSAEQLRVSVAIAMAANPKLRVLRIKEGSLLDEDGIALIQKMAEGGDYQIWIERVDTSGKVGIVMEDGAVAMAAPAAAAE